MGIFGKLSDLFSAEEDGPDSGRSYDQPKADPSSWRSAASSDDSSYSRKDPVRRDYGREAVREPLDGGYARPNVIPIAGKSVVDKLTQKFKIVTVEPRSYDEATKFVDSLKARKPVIINLELCDDRTSEKLLDFLSGGIYALGGSVLKITEDVFVFAPENVDISSLGKEQDAFVYTES